MTPTLAISNSVNLCYTNSELFSDHAELGSAASHHSDFNNLRFGNLSRSVRLSVSHFFRMLDREVVNAPWTPFWVNLKKIPSLTVAIHEVVSLCSGKKVAWIYAGAIIASVTNAKTFWNFTVKQSVCESVRQLVKTFCIFSNCEHPIPRPIFSSRPNPAPSRQLWVFNWVRERAILANFGPKSSDFFFSHKQVGMLPNFLT